MLLNCKASPRRAGQVVVVGASVRGAVTSLARLGYVPIAVDAFGDWDTRQVAGACCVSSRYPHDLPRWMGRWSGLPWCYGGGLENHPHWLRRWEMRGPLWGIAPAVLPALRDPWHLSASLARGGFRMPSLSRKGRVSAEWLCKPRWSAGGRAIQRGGSSGPQPPRGPHYWQPFVRGVARNGTFAGNGSHCQLLGVTGAIAEVDPQFSASHPARHSEFQYGGSWGPIVLPPDQYEWWRSLGNHLTAHYRLRGLFGVDTIWDGSEHWILEVNPRWPGSTDILERACGINGMEWHLQGCGIAPATWDAVPPAQELWCKEIIWVPQGGHVTHPLFQTLLEHRDGYADLPCPGTQIPPHAPYLTLFTHAPNLPQLRASHQARRTALLDQWRAASLESGNAVRP